MAEIKQMRNPTMNMNIEKTVEDLKKTLEIHKENSTFPTHPSDQLALIMADLGTAAKRFNELRTHLTSPLLVHKHEAVTLQMRLKNGYILSLIELAKKALTAAIVTQNSKE